MKYSELLPLTFSLSAALIAFSGCERDEGSKPDADARVTSAEVQEEVDEAADATERFVEQSREEYQQRVASELSELKEKIAAFEARIEQAGDDAKAKVDDALAAVKQKQRAAENKLAEIRDSAPDAWRDMRSGFDEAIKDLRQAFQNAQQEFEG